MALTFPQDPTDGQIYGQYIFDSTSGTWKIYDNEYGLIDVLDSKANLSGGNTFTGNQIINSGVLTVTNQPTFHAGISGYGSTTSNYFPTLAESFNVGFTRSGNNRLTAQVAGKYYVAAQQLVNTGGTTVYFHIMKNGGSVVYAYSNSDDTYDMNVSALLSLQVNDYIEIYYAPTTTYSWPAPHSSYSVFKVS